MSAEYSVLSTRSVKLRLSQLCCYGLSWDLWLQPVTCPSGQTLTIFYYSSFRALYSSPTKCALTTQVYPNQTAAANNAAGGCKVSLATVSTCSQKAEDVRFRIYCCKLHRVHDDHGVISDHTATGVALIVAHLHISPHKAAVRLLNCVLSETRSCAHIEPCKYHGNLLSFTGHY